MNARRRIAPAARCRLPSQVSNPVAAFATDNNGVALVMPAVSAGGATTLTGTLIFGIDTQANNQIGSATVYAANSSGNFTTTYKGTSLTSSFLDSGSNGLFFSDSTIPACSSFKQFQWVLLPGRDAFAVRRQYVCQRRATGTVSFTIVNPQALSTTIRAAPSAAASGAVPRQLRLGFAILLRSHGVRGHQRGQHAARHRALLGLLAQSRIGAVQSQLHFFRLSCHS